MRRNMKCCAAAPGSRAAVHSVSGSRLKAGKVRGFAAAVVRKLHKDGVVDKLSDQWVLADPEFAAWIRSGA
jgi:hypothetical protein